MPSVRCKGHHHGLTNAVLMPFVLSHNRPAIAPAMASLADALHLDGEPFPAVRQWILDLRRRLAIPETVTALGLARRIPRRSPAWPPPISAPA